MSLHINIATFLARFFLVGKFVLDRDLSPKQHHQEKQVAIDECWVYDNFFNLLGLHFTYGGRPNLFKGSQQNMEKEGKRAVTRVATYSHQLIRQIRLEP